jgi:hypothetical protein
MLLVLAIITSTIGTATAPPTAGAQSAFAFQLMQTENHRGVAVEGYVYNALPWRITNVRVQVDSIDANGAVIASASGWVLGDVPARGRAYVYVPVSTPTPDYRASVRDFDKVMLEAPQAP